MAETYPATVGGRYTLEGPLGAGGMGQVFKARHLQLGKLFALKIISPAFALDTDARQRFNEEAKLASEIAHPNIVAVVDFGEDEQYGAYMVMEMVDGDPLITEGTGPMAVRRACDILSQLADALEHIHRRGIIHGDVKADNVMLTAETGAAAEGARRRRIARLLDFGLASRSGSGESTDEVNGSPHYMAPERAAGGPASVAADVYALGVLAYLLVTGTLPFDSDGTSRENVVEILMRHVHEPPDPPSTRRHFDETEQPMEALILRALAKDPSLRPASAAAFRHELNTVMDMLDMARRRRTSGQIFVPTSAREASIVTAFDSSAIPQAMLSLDGRVEHANKAFSRLCGVDDAEGLMFSATALASAVPGLTRALKAAHADGKSLERHARIYRGPDMPALELALWFSPVAVAGSEIHLFIRSEEEDPRRRARDSGGGY